MHIRSIESTDAFPFLNINLYFQLVRPLIRLNMYVTGHARSIERKGVFPLDTISNKSLFPLGTFLNIYIFDLRLLEKPIEPSVVHSSMNAMGHAK